MNQIVYLFFEALRSFKEHKLVLFPTLITIFLCASLLCVSLFFLRAGTRLLDKQSDFYSIEVFLKDNLSEEEKANIEVNLKTEKWLDSLEYISKEKAAEIFKKEFSASMFDLVESNPLPDSYRLYLKKRYQTPEILEEWKFILERSPYFDAVQAPVSFAKVLTKWKWNVFIIPVLCIVLLLTTLILIMRNAIQLSLFSRKILVENMKYTGASRFFIEFPFVVEGFLIGFISSAFASFVLVLFMQMLVSKFPVLRYFTEGNFLPVFISVFSVTSISAFVSFRTVRLFLQKDRGVLA